MKFTPGLISNPLDLAGTHLVREGPSVAREILYCVQYTTFTSVHQLALCSISNSEFGDQVPVTWPNAEHRQPTPAVPIPKPGTPRGPG
jgi:hypothetical protein